MNKKQIRINVKNAREELIDKLVDDDYYTNYPAFVKIFANIDGRVVVDDSELVGNESNNKWLELHSIETSNNNIEESINEGWNLAGEDGEPSNEYRRGWIKQFVDVELSSINDMTDEVIDFMKNGYVKCEYEVENQ